MAHLVVRLLSYVGFHTPVGFSGPNYYPKEHKIPGWLFYIKEELLFRGGFGRGLFSWIVLLWIFIGLKAIIMLMRSTVSKNKFYKAEKNISAAILLLLAASYFFSLLWTLVVLHFQQWWSAIALPLLIVTVPLLYMDVRRILLKWKYRPRNIK